MNNERAMASNAADEAKRHSEMHQKWIIETLQKNGGSCSYGELVEVGEEHQCDTVGAQLKILKNRKNITFKQMFLMYPMHSAEVVTLLKPLEGMTDAPAESAAENVVAESSSSSSSSSSDNNDNSARGR